MREKNYSLLCRICLERSTLCCNIYVGRSADKDPIYEVINYVYDLQISVDDGLPGYICQRCLAIVKEFKVYKTNAHKAKTELLKKHRAEDVFIKNESAEIGSENDEFVSLDEGSPVGDQVSEDVCDISIDKEACPANVETWEENHVLKHEAEESFALENDLENTGEFADDGVPYSDQFEEGLPMKTEILDENALENNDMKSEEKNNPRIRHYQCEKCGIIFLEKQTLRKHLSLLCRQPRHRSIGDWGYSELVDSLDDSSQVQEECFSQLELVENSTANTMVKNYHCDECGRKFARCHSFKAHLRVHSQENPNQCSVCGWSFSQRYDLVRHYESTHLKLKPFQCAECGRCFARKYHLVRHIKVHHVVVIE